MNRRKIAMDVVLRNTRARIGRRRSRGRSSLRRHGRRRMSHQGSHDSLHISPLRTERGGMRTRVADVTEVWSRRGQSSRRIDRRNRSREGRNWAISARFRSTFDIRTKTRNGNSLGLDRINNTRGNSLQILLALVQRMITGTTNSSMHRASTSWRERRS